MSFHDYEQRIMALVDQGLSVDQVVARTGYSRKTVERTAARLRVGSNSAWEAAVRSGSQALARACARTGGRFQ